MPYIKFSKITPNGDQRNTEQTKFFDLDISIVKGLTAAAHRGERKIDEFHLHCVKLLYKGVEKDAWVLVGYDQNENPFNGPNDYVVCGCPPGEIPGNEL